MTVISLKAKLAEKAKEEAKLDFRGEVLWSITMAAFLMASADGEIAEEELEQMIVNIVQISENPDVTAEAVEDLLSAISDMLEEHGFDACTKEVARRLSSRELRQAAIMIAAGIVFIDGELAPAEEEAFRRLANALGFSEEEAVALVAEAME